MTWASGIALEALLRCGQHDEKGVIRAINTLLTMSNGRNWCGCGYFDTREKNYIPDSPGPADFNRFPVWKENWRHGLDWFTDEKDVASFVCDNHDRSALGIGARKALLVRNFHSTGECTMVIQRALSLHPDYPGSSFETNVALSCTWYQGSDGSWGDAYLSTAFGLLERALHPIAGFLVLRSIPRLIRQQKKTGLWQEKKIRDCQPPTEQESTFMILRTLRRFNYLERLLP